MEDTITALIPTIPPRKHLLPRALKSVHQQTYPVEDIVVESDLNSTGGAATRNRALEKVTTKWVAFLDDDDTWYSRHLEALLAIAKAEDASMAWSKWDGINQHLLGRLVQSARTLQTYRPPITCLVKTDLVREVGGFTTTHEYMGTEPKVRSHGRVDAGNDQILWLKLYKLGVTFAFCDKVTWTWRSDMPHTSGSPWKG